MQALDPVSPVAGAGAASAYRHGLCPGRLHAERDAAGGADGHDRQPRLRGQDWAFPLYRRPWPRRAGEASASKSNFTGRGTPVRYELALKSLCAPLAFGRRVRCCDQRSRRWPLRDRPQPRRRPTPKPSRTRSRGEPAHRFMRRMSGEALVDHGRVELHQGRAGADLGIGVGARADAAAADQRELALDAEGMPCAALLSRAPVSRAPGQAAGLAPPVRPQRGVAAKAWCCR